MTRVAIYGAGAVGGLLGARLAATDVDLTLIARGPHLAAIRDKGLTLIDQDSAGQTIAVTATDNPLDAGVQDFVIVTLKAHSVPAVVDAMQPLLGLQTAVVMAVNGFPWWYFYDLDGPWRDRRVASVDPGGCLWDGIGPERAIGCTVYPASDVPEPGVIRHISGDRFSLGEPSGERTGRIELLSAMFREAGFKAPIRPKLRDEIWIKLWGNLCFNPISALTNATLDVICTDPGTRSLCRAMMLEAQAIGEALGANFAIDVEKRIEGGGAVGAHRTSMLQDLELGRPMEIDALVTVVQELGVMTGIKTPNIDTILALVQQRGRVAGVYG